MSELEIHLLRSLVAKKPRVRLQLQKVCSVPAPTESQDPTDGSNVSVKEVPIFPTQPQTPDTLAAEPQKPCFIVNRDPIYLSNDKSAFDLVLRVTPQTNSEEMTLHESGSHRRLGAEETVGLAVSAQYGSDGRQHKHTVFESVIPSGVRPAHNWLGHIVFCGSAPTQVAVKHQRLLTYSTGATRWRFLVDYSLVHRVRVVPVLSFDPEDLFWSVCLYARYLRRPRSDEHPLECCIKSLYELFRTELTAKQQELHRLRADSSSSPGGLAQTVSHFEQWCSRVRDLIHTSILQPILASTEAAVSLVDSQATLDTHLPSLVLGLQRLLLRGPGDSTVGTSTGSLETQLSALLSRRNEWRVLGVLRSLGTHGSTLLDTAFETVLERAPQSTTDRLQTTVTQILQADLEVLKLVKSANTLLRGEESALSEWKQPTATRNFSVVNKDELFKRVVFDTDGRVLAKRTVRSSELRPVEQMLIWEQKLVLITALKISAHPLSYITAWDSRCTSKALVYRYKGHAISENPTFRWFLRHILQAKAVHSTYDRGGQRSYVHIFQSLGFVRHLYLRLDFSNETIGVRFQKPGVLSPPGPVIADVHGGIHSIFVGASDGITSLHFRSFQCFWNPDEHSGLFFGLGYTNQAPSTFLLADLDNPMFNSRLICPVPVNLVAPKAKAHRINYSSWVELLMFACDSQNPRKHLIYFYVQSVEIQPTQCGRASHLVTKVSLLECYTERFTNEDRYFPSFGEFFECTLSTVRLPHSVRPHDTVIFDPEEAPWAHCFVWKRLPTGVFGFRITPNGRYSVFRRTTRNFQLLCHRRLSVSHGRYVRLKLSAASDGSTGGYFWKNNLSRATGQQVCNLFEIAVVL